MYRKVRSYPKLNIKLNKIKIKPLSKLNFVIITLIFIGIFIFTTFQAINKKITPILIQYAELETRKFATSVVNKTVTDNVTKEIKVEELFIITKDNAGEIKTIDFNSIIVNKLLEKVTSNVKMSLKYLERGQLDKIGLDETFFVDYNKEKLENGIIFEIPSGIVFGNTLLSNLGPKIPVKFGLIGDIMSSINTKVTNYGINNALVEVSVKLELNEQVILPFISKTIVIETNIPIALKLIQGVVPKYYMNGLNQNSPILTLPIE